MRGKTPMHYRLPGKTFQRDLRKHATPAEKMMWQSLRNRRMLSRKFRRQHQIGPYVVDFYCVEEKLAVELFGSVHEDPLRCLYDEARTAFLETLGIRVVCFQNQEVFKLHDLVLEVLAAYINTPSPCPSPPPGRGDVDFKAFMLF